MKAGGAAAGGVSFWRESGEMRVNGRRELKLLDKIQLSRPLQSITQYVVQSGRNVAL
jgi:hypothetical protein